MHITELFKLDGKTALVTGGTSHLGSSIAEALSESGAEVFLSDRDLEKAKDFSNTLQAKTNNSVHGCSLDLSSTASIQQCFTEIEKSSNKLDILINNASSNPEGNLLDISEKQWLDGIDGTINGVFRTMKQAIPLMKKNNFGSIINISSIYGTISPDPSIYENTTFDSPPQYGTGKAAINQFSRYAATHLAKFGIRVNSISPGAFPQNDVQQNSDFISRLNQKIPLGRIGKPDELKGIVVFLASDASSYVTGQNIHVDGGWTTL